MPHIKELVIHGFKSFARETRVPFRNTMNAIVGPNGSGKSNVTDAICFVLGRMGSKSMRAKKLSNLIFAGTNQYKPASEASVELVFDNSDKGFSVEDPEVSIKRILRKNGQGVYKINNEIKTRQEVLELLAQAGIDPNGFNIVLQGEIDSFVKMPAEQRREVIEEVAGISIYEMRKQKSLKELEKTEARLKETSAILRERNAYLKNLEEERKQALHFQKLQDNVKLYKASINHKILSEKQDKLDELGELIKKEQDSIAKLNAISDKTTQEIAVLNDKIKNITDTIQKSSGLEQERLNSEISDLRADLAGLTIRQQSYANQLEDLRKRKEEIEIAIKNSEREIAEMSKSKGKTIGKDLEIKKKQLEELDENKRKLYMLKSNLSSMSSRVEEKQRQIQRLKTEYDFTFNKIKEMESQISIKDSIESHREKIVLLKSKLESLQKESAEQTQTKISDEKAIAVTEKHIEDQAKVQSQVSSLDTCPLCKTKITKDHVNHVVDNAEKEKEAGKTKIKELKERISELEKNIKEAGEHYKRLEEELRNRNHDVIQLEMINDKKDALRKLTEDLKTLESENSENIKKRDKIESELGAMKTSELNYDSLRLEIQEMERHQESHLGMEITLKQRDIERNRNILKQVIRELDEVKGLLDEVNEDIEEKQIAVEEKNEQDTMLKEKFRKTLEEKNKHQEKIHFFERDLMHKGNDKRVMEEKINNFKIERAQFLAQKEAIESESKEFAGIKVVKMPIEELRKKIEETQATISRIGTVNMRALEVYENVKVEYDKVQEKVDTIIQEKEEILKIIEDIDKKKKKAFSQTLEQINTLFSRNFSQLSDKGIATLEPSNPEDIFAGGVDMIIKVGKGKYFDTHSLSGGEQSLISLSLIFAIQEYKPYCFYIFDEIDAALDRRNSERLAGLLKHYMNKGQYIIITHNDSLITESPTIYGVSMQDKISKVVSLEV